MRKVQVPPDPGARSKKKLKPCLIDQTCLWRRCWEWVLYYCRLLQTVWLCPIFRFYTRVWSGRSASARFVLVKISPGKKMRFGLYLIFQPLWRGFASPTQRHLEPTQRLCVGYQCIYDLSVFFSRGERRRVFSIKNTRLLCKEHTCCSLTSAHCYV